MNKIFASENVLHLFNTVIRICYLYGNNKKCPMHAYCEDVKQLFHILKNAKNFATTVYQKMIDLTFRDPHSHFVEHPCFIVIK